MYTKCVQMLYEITAELYILTEGSKQKFSELWFIHFVVFWIIIWLNKIITYEYKLLAVWYKLNRRIITYVELSNDLAEPIHELFLSSNQKGNLNR